jgi:hypothetical protein
MHPPELERQREFAQFDPVVEGARLGLSRELSLAIWERVSADATDGAGVCNTGQVAYSTTRRRTWSRGALA